MIVVVGALGSMRSHRSQGIVETLNAVAVTVALLHEVLTIQL